MLVAGGGGHHPVCFEGKDIYERMKLRLLRLAGLSHVLQGRFHHSRQRAVVCYTEETQYRTGNIFWRHC